MILVLLGTASNNFDRLVKEVDKIAKKSKKKFIVQLGNSKYRPKNVSFFDFEKKEKILKYIEKAEIIISQGGFGSLYDCLKKGKKVVAVPRLKKFNEAKEHQKELVETLEKKGRVIAVYDIENLEHAIQKAYTFQPNNPEGHRIPELVREFIENSK